MTQADKELLLKDLCARWPYGVICQFIWTYSNETTDGEDVIAKEDDSIRCIDIHTKEILADYYGEWVDVEYCKPYLRPMSSMTEEEKDELTLIKDKDFETVRKWYNSQYMNEIDTPCPVTSGEVDYCNKHHIDYRGLIEKGLAIEAPEGMYKTD